VFPKAHTGAASVSYEDAVRHALCFGWIDSLIKRIDDDRFARKFTPRKASSAWSASNRARWRELEQQGLLASAGRAASPVGRSSAAPPAIPELPVGVSKALKTSPDAWRAFQHLAPSHRRQYVAWIHTAKRYDTRDRRIRETIRLLLVGKPLGLK
jgi:uncharacterized protein YdeI (YjbR/CyaY-like superfamily)